MNDVALPKGIGFGTKQNLFIIIHTNIHIISYFVYILRDNFGKNPVTKPIHHDLLTALAFYQYSAKKLNISTGGYTASSDGTVRFSATRVFNIAVFTVSAT